MRPTTRTRGLAALGLGLALLVAAPARADDTPADIVSLLERARAAERVEKDLAKAQALYEQVFAKAAPTDAGREAGIRLLDLDAGRTHETWLALIGTLSDAHGPKLDNDVVDKLVELAQRHVQPGETVRTPRGVFVRIAEQGPAEAALSPALRALLAGLHQLEVSDWMYAPAIPDGVETDVDRVLASLGDDARAAVQQLLAMRRHPYVDSLLAMLRVDRVAGWEAIGKFLRDVPAMHRGRLANMLESLYAWGPVDSTTLLDVLRPVMESDNAESVHDKVFAFLLRRAEDPVDARYADLARTDRLRMLWWEFVVSRVDRDPARILSLATLGAYLPSRDEGLLRVTKDILALDGNYTHGAIRAESERRDDAWRDACAGFARYALDLPAIRSLFSLTPARDPSRPPEGELGVRQRLVEGLVQRSQSAASQAARRDAARWSARRLLEAQQADRRKWVQYWRSSAEVSFEGDVVPPSDAVPRLLDLLEDLDEAVASSRADVAKAALRIPGVWDGLLDRLASTGGTRSPLGWVVALDGLPQPPSGERAVFLRWIQLFLAGSTAVPPPATAIWQTASEDDAARYDRLVLDALTTRGSLVPAQALVPLTDAEPDRIMKWLETMEAPSVARRPSGFLARTVLSHVRHKIGAGPVLERAEDPQSPFSTEALSVAAESREQAVQERLVQLAAREAAQNPSPALEPARQLQWLAFADRYPARGLVPLLVAIYEAPEGAVGTSRMRAAGVLDKIRDREDRIRYFRSMLDGPDDPEGEILPLLEDEDAAVRQGAIQALGAVGGPRALVQLLKLAKREAAPAAERAAALEAVAKISARAPAGTAPTTAPPPAPAEAGSGGGK